jgi:hypothetical protein
LNVFCISVQFVYKCTVFPLSDQLSLMLSVHFVTCAILHSFMILQNLGPFVILMFLCPAVNAMQNEQAFRDISFNMFNDFIA